MFGVRIIQTEAALKDTTEPNFPPSRHRSKRIFKKLLKRHGYKKVPAIWHLPNGTISAHPVLYQQIRLELDRAGVKPRNDIDDRFYGLFRAY